MRGRAYTVRTGSADVGSTTEGSVDVVAKFRSGAKTAWVSPVDELGAACTGVAHAPDDIGSAAKKPPTLTLPSEGPLWSPDLETEKGAPVAPGAAVAAVAHRRDFKWMNRVKAIKLFCFLSLVAQRITPRKTLKILKKNNQVDPISLISKENGVKAFLNFL